MQQDRASDPGDRSLQTPQLGAGAADAPVTPEQLVWGAGRDVGAQGAPVAGSGAPTGMLHSAYRRAGQLRGIIAPV